MSSIQQQISFNQRPFLPQMSVVLL